MGGIARPLDRKLDRSVPTPLTKRGLDGTRYTRPPEIEAALTRVLALPRDGVIAQAQVRDPADPAFIPSECLIHLLRHSRRDNNDAYFERLYKALMDRVDRALPRAESRRGDEVHEDFGRAQIRDQVRDRLQVMLVEDRKTPGDRLDFFEVRFAAAIASLRGTAREKAWREANRSEPLELGPEDGELSVEVERAAGSLDVETALLSDDPNYRSHLDAAIDALPTDQRRIIEMLRAGMLIDSSEPGVVSIRQVLGCAEKTVRNRRDAAIRALRAALRLEDER